LIHFYKRYHQNNYFVNMAKRTFFGVFKNQKNEKAEDSSEEEEEKEPVRVFKFNTSSKETIKNHFQVVGKETQKTSSKGRSKEIKVNDVEKKETKPKTKEKVKNEINDEVKNSIPEQLPKITKKKSFLGVLREEKKNVEKDEEERLPFRFDREPEEIIKNQTKSKSGGRAKEANESPRKSSQGKSPRKSSRGKSSRKTGEVKETENVKISFVKEDKKNAVLKKGLSFSSASPRKSLAKNKKSIVKMMTMSQSYAATEESPKKAPEAKPKSPKKKSTKKKKDKGLTKIDSFYKAISIDDLLKLPETVGDTGLTMDEILDKVDLEIKEQQSKYEAEMKILDQTIEKQREKRAALEKRMEENGRLRDQLTEGLTKPVLEEMFEKNVQYFADIRDGKIESSRHNSFHSGPQSRQGLLYTMITHPFTDQQVDWTYEKFRAKWMTTTKQFHQFNEYMWKVLLPECFIKFYMDFFQFTKQEAEIRIKETPMVDDED